MTLVATVAVGCGDSSAPADGDGSGDSTTATTSTTTSGSSTTAAGSSSGPGGTGTGSTPADGTMTVLTYNVAGLPQGISGGNPEVNTPLISPLLNAYDLALVQEDFSYHGPLAGMTDHRFQSVPSMGGGGFDLGDGLNRFSRTPFSDHQRDAWVECFGELDNGSDCLTSKGFAVAEHELAPGVVIDIYNLHMDAGGSAGDIAARQAQVQQLLAAITARSDGEAIIVAGDTNMDEEDEADLQTLIQGAGLTDTCRALSCGQDGRIDRILFRNAPGLELTPSNWRVDPTFVDAEGMDLSDHEAVGVDFAWASG